jgi:hypothetical protein
MGKKMPINPFDTLSHLEQERYRAMILHTSPDKSPSMSLFCQKVSNRRMENIWIY